MGIQIDKFSHHAFTFSEYKFSPIPPILAEGFSSIMAAGVSNDFLVNSKKALIREITSQRQKILDDLKATENSILITIEASRIAIHRTLLEAHSASSCLVNELHAKETALWKSLQKRELALFQLHLDYGDAMQGIAATLKEKQLAVEEERQALGQRRKQLEKWVSSVQQQLFNKETELNMLQRTLEEDINVFAAARKKEEAKRRGERHEFAKLKRIVSDHELATPEVRGAVSSTSSSPLTGTEQLILVEGEPTALLFQVIVASSHRDAKPCDVAAAVSRKSVDNESLLTASAMAQEKVKLQTEIPTSGKSSAADSEAQKQQVPPEQVGRRFFTNVYATATFIEFPGDTPPDIAPVKISPEGTIAFPHVVLAEGSYTLQISVPRVAAGITRPMNISLIVIPEQVLRLQVDAQSEGNSKGLGTLKGSISSTIALGRVTLWMMPRPSSSLTHQLQSVVELDYCGVKGSRDFLLQCEYDPSTTTSSSTALSKNESLLEVFYTLHHFPTRLLRAQYRVVWVSSSTSDNVQPKVTFVKNLHIAQNEIASVAVDVVPLCGELVGSARELMSGQLSPSGRLVAVQAAADPTTIIASQWNGNVRHSVWSPPSKLCVGAAVTRFCWSTDSRWLLCAVRDGTRSGLQLFDCINLGDFQQTGMTTMTALALPLGVSAQEVAQMNCLDRSIALQTVDGSVYWLADRLAPSSVANAYGFLNLCNDSLAFIVHEVSTLDGTGPCSRRCTVARRGATVTSFSHDGKVAVTAQLSAPATIVHAKFVLSPLGLQLQCNSKLLVCLHESSLSVLDQRFLRTAECGLCPSGSMVSVESQSAKEAGSTMVISSRISEFWSLSSKKIASKKLLHSSAIPGCCEIVMLMASPSGELELARVRAAV